MNTELILAKIAEMKADNNRLWNELDSDWINKGQTEFFDKDHENHLYNAYDGDSVSHIFDILEEQNHILQRLEDYIKANM